MKKIEYKRVGDYEYPTLELNESKPIGKYGMMKKQYMKSHDQGVYFSLLSSGKLNDYLVEIDNEVNHFYDTMLVSYQHQYNINEELKERDQMKWIQEMNCIHHMICLLYTSDAADD